METEISNNRRQLQYIQDFLIKIADGDYNSKLLIADEKDEQLASVQTGINMLVEELKETTISRVFLNSIYNGINDVLIVLNEKGEIQKTNPVAASLLLYTESELFNLSIDKLIQISDFDIVKGCIRDTFEQQKLNEIGLNLAAKDGNLISVSCSFSPLYNTQGKPSGILLVAKNISTLSNAKNQLQEKSDELSLFVYKASHDLKSPVSSMESVMTMLKESKSMEEVKMYAKMADTCIDSLNTVINDLLVLGRITYGALEFETLDINVLINSILKSIEFMDNFKNIHFNISIDENVKSIITEKGLLNTVLLNLIDNAVKYSQKREEPSFINIKVSNKDKGIFILINDNGIGIKEKHHDDLFKMFYRATSVSKGSGLGLYIVKTSVTKLGGSISFESAFDKGTTFKLYIPSKKDLGI